MDDMDVKLVRLCPNCGPTSNYDADLKCTACGRATKEEVIAGDVAVVPPAPLAAPPMQQVERVERSKRMCIEYGKEIDVDARFCQYCGMNIPDSRVSETGIVGLAAIGGIFGLHGLGHLTLGRIPMGFLVLFAGWALIAGAVLSYVVGWLPTGETSYFALIGILAVAYILLFVWQVMDANDTARKHNRDYEAHKVA